jgi:hypothetical protein
MITKQTIVDQITIQENGIILYREATRIIEDGKELTKTYHRSSLTPGQDLTGQPEKVVAIAQMVWSDEATRQWVVPAPIAADSVGADSV